MILIGDIKKNIEICRKCDSFYENADDENSMFGSIRCQDFKEEEGESLCYNSIEKFVKGYTPQWCPYRLEHVVMEDKNESNL